jgi:ABC-type multidrug transport system ATPase subunit
MPMTPLPALSLRALIKRYDGGLLALDNFPTAGVDFELRIELWRYIRRLHEQGTTILLTTHYLEEAEELCQDVALIRGGRLLARDSPAGRRPWSLRSCSFWSSASRSADASAMSTVLTTGNSSSPA